MSNGIPTARHDEPTHHVVWEVIEHANQPTARVRFAESEPDSDGIPHAIDVEHSATVAVVLTDLDEAFELVRQLANRDGLDVKVLQMPGMTGKGVLGVLVGGWRRFQGWFPTAIREAEPYLFRSMGNRKASAVVVRLRALADAFMHQMPPNRLDFFALRIE